MNVSLAKVGDCRVASGHTATNTPDLFRTPKLTVAGPGQYWGGGPPGKPFGCCWLFMFFDLFDFVRRTFFRSGIFSTGRICDTHIFSTVGDRVFW